MNGDLLTFGVVATIFAGLVAVGIHQAVNRFLALIDGHLERLQGKLDVLLAAQIEHNEKIDLILRKLY